MRLLQILIFIFGSNFALVLSQSNCNFDHVKQSFATSTMIYAFLRWQNLKEMVIWDYFDNDCIDEIKFKRHFTAILNEHDRIYLTFQSDELSLNLTNHHLGVALAVDSVESANFLKSRSKVNKKENFGEHYIWLMITYGRGDDLKMELKYNWTIGFDTDLTIAFVNPDIFDGFTDLESLYSLFDQLAPETKFSNLQRKEDWATRVTKYKVPLRDLQKWLTESDLVDIFANFTKTMSTIIWDPKVLDLVKYDDATQENLALAYYNKLSTIDPNITLDMVKTSFGLWPRDIMFCRLYKINRQDDIALFFVDQFYKIDSSTDPHECFVNQLGALQQYNLHIGNHAIEIEERNNLRGRVLKVARIETNSTEDSSLYTIFMNFLASSLNARLVVQTYDSYGSLNVSPGQNNTVFSSIIGGFSDIALEPITQTLERTAVMEFTIPILNSYRNIYLQQPHSSVIRDIYLAPFSPLLLLAVAVVAILLVVLLKISYVVANENDMTFSDSVIWCVGILCQQGSTEEPKTAASSVIIISSLFFALIIYNAYAAAITSKLSFKTDNIDSIDELIRTGYSVIGVANSSELDFLEEYYPTSVELTTLYRGLKSSGNALPMNNTEGLFQTVHSRVAHFGDQRFVRQAIYNLKKNEYCKISEVVIKAAHTKQGFPMPMKSKYRKLIGHSFLTMMEHGISDRMQQHMLPIMPNCVNPNAFYSASLSDLATAYILILSGMGIGLVSAIIENIVRRKE